MKELRVNVNLVIGVTTLGKSKLLQNQLETLSNQTDLDFKFILCDQSGGLLDEYLHALDKAPFRSKAITSVKLGASRGRNMIITAAPGNTTHFLFPNDTSRFEIDFVEKVKRECLNRDLLVLGYRDSDCLRYTFPTGDYALTRENVWNAIEPATVFSSNLFNLIGGFDETIGAGADSPFRSGEGTDLLLRAIPFITEVFWVPTIQVIGVPQSFSLTKKQSREKLYYYGRGYGWILKKYKYSFGRKAAAIFGPFLKIEFVTSGIAGVLNAFFSSFGRLVSICSSSRSK